MKKKISLSIGLILVLTLLMQSFVVAKPIKKSIKTETIEQRIQTTLKNELAKKQKEKKAKSTEPDYINKPEINAFQFPYMESTLEYMLFGGMNYYTETYAKKIPDGLVKITAKDPGTLIISAESSNTETTTLVLYDENKTRLGTIVDGTMIPNVKKGDVYYVELPVKVEMMAMTTIVLEDHITKLKNGGTMIQTGTGQMEYRTFRLSKRSAADMWMASLSDGPQRGTFAIQKYTKGSWKTVSRMTSRNITNIGFGSLLSYGLKKGTYRFACKMPKGVMYSFGYLRTSMKKKYATKKEHAQIVKKNSVRENLFTTTEKKSRWYQIKRTTIRGKNQYIGVYAYTAIGKMKISIYKKGTKKPLKTKIINGASDQSYYMKFKPKQGVGTYFVKIKKIGKNTNGGYEVYNHTK